MGEHNDTPVKPGKLLMIDEGSYSNHTTVGFFVVLREFVPSAILQQYLGTPAHTSSRRDQDARDPTYNIDRFLAFMLSQGLLLEIEYGNLYLADNSKHVSEFAYYPFET